MNKNRIKVIVLTSFLLLFLAGCINVNRNFKEISKNVLSNFDDSFKKETEFAIGPTAMHLVSSFVQFDSESNDMDMGLMFRQVDRIQIGVYKRNKTASFANYEKNKLSDNLGKDNWTRLVISKEPEKVSEVFVKEEEMRLTKMLVVNAEIDQMIIVELSGDLDELIAVAIANNGLNIAVKK